MADKPNSKIYSANYVVCAHNELTRFLDTLPFDNAYKLNNNLQQIEDTYHTLSNLVLEDLQRALRMMKEENATVPEPIQELHDIFQDLTTKYCVHDDAE